jgi:hypothetical protein
VSRYFSNLSPSTRHRSPKVDRICNTAGTTRFQLVVQVVRHQWASCASHSNTKFAEVGSDTIGMLYKATSSANTGDRSLARHAVFLAYSPAA